MKKRLLLGFVFLMPLNFLFCRFHALDNVPDYDHIAGNSALRENSIVLAHERCKLQLIQYADPEFDIPFDKALFRNAYPTITLEETIKLYFNGEEIQIIPLTGGHTDEDIIVYFKNLGVVCLGDVINPGSFPVVKIENGGNAHGLLKNVERLISLFPEDVIFIVGHGRDVTVKELHIYQDMLRKTMAIVQAAMKANKTPEEAKRMNILEDWSSFDDPNYKETTAGAWIETIFRSSEDKREEIKDPMLTGPYLGQHSPGMEAEVFAPGIVSTDDNEVMYGFFNGATVFIFERSDPNFNGDWIYIPVYSVKLEEGKWTQPVKPEYLEVENLGPAINSAADDTRPYVTPDGKFLFFNSDRSGSRDIFWADARIIDEVRSEILGISSRESEHLKEIVNDGYGDYLLVPAGEFEMGDNFHEGNPDERPVHKVYLSDYYIGKYEVTNAEYKKFMEDGGYENQAFWSAGGFGEFGAQPLYWDNNTDADPRNGRRGTTFYQGRHVHGGGVPGHENFPVNGVSWYEAMAYCSWLSSKAGHKYRLPTEAEWEKAARGSYEHNRDNPELGHQRRYPWGDDLDNSYGNFWNSGDPYDNGTAPVGYYDGSKHGSYQTKINASPYGAYDMAGNVFEWCLDFYVRSDKDAPHSSVDYRERFDRGTVNDPRGPSSGAEACLRSSDWHHNAVSEKDKYYHNPLCSFRNFDPPHWRGANFGFRCVREK